MDELDPATSDDVVAAVADVDSDDPRTTTFAEIAATLDAEFRKPRKIQSLPRVSAAAVSAGARPEVLAKALDVGGWTHLGALQRYLGGASVDHALTWLSYRTLMFEATD